MMSVLEDSYHCEVCIYEHNSYCVRTEINLYCILHQVTAKLTALKGLDARLREIRSYLDLVVDGKLPLNHEILYHLQVRIFMCFNCTDYGYNFRALSKTL